MCVCVCVFDEYDYIILIKSEIWIYNATVLQIN